MTTMIEMTPIAAQSASRMTAKKIRATVIIMSYAS